MYKYYDKVYLYKPMQTYTNDEFYLICYKFNDNKIDDIYNKILNIKYEEINELEKYIDEKYYYSIYKIYKKLIKFKYNAVNNKLYLVDNYYIINNNKNILNYIYKINEKIRNKFIKKFEFK